MSSLIAAARRDPSFAEDHVRPNANGTVSVLLYNDQRHPQWITVTGPLPADGASLMGAHGHVSPWNVSSPTWVSYYEKALAQSVDRAPMDLIGAEGTYRSFDWGNDAQGSMPTITGHESVDISTSVRGAFDTVSSDARAGKLVTINTKDHDYSSHIPGYVGNHEFYFQSFDQQGNMVFGNPWGSRAATITVTPDNVDYFIEWTVG